MPVNQALDSLQFEDLAFPYNRVRGDLFEEPMRLVAGQNLYITPGGKIARRPGLSALTNGTLTKRVDRIWLYETLDTPPYAYYIASVYNSGTSRWELYYQRLSSTPGSWTQVSALRESNTSTAPHEGSSARGLFFVKGFPTAGSGEKLGSIIIDGSGGTIAVRPWGLLGPTVPAHINGAVTKTTATINTVSTTLQVNSVTGFPATPFSIQVDYEEMQVTAQAGAGPYNLTVTRGYNGTFVASHPLGTPVLYHGWTASAHACQVNYGWEYNYCWKTITNHYSNRAPVETNPDNLPSVTGPFTNLIPAITVKGHADTTNIPKVAILRKTDGGGTYYVLDEITNTGAGDISYSDNKRASASGNADPIDDLALSRNAFGPSLTSNSPPPTVNAPLVVGTDTPVRTTPIVHFQGRFWYAIGNVLHFCANTEINVGIGEEAFPSGIKGNFFRFQYPIINLVATNRILYIFTLQTTYALTGNNRETFSDQAVFENVGAPYGHPRAVETFGEYVAFLTHDYRIAIAKEDTIKFISESLGDELVQKIEAGAEIEIKYWADTQFEYLIVFAHNLANPTLSRQYVFDLARAFGEALANFNGRTDEFWFTPWTIPSVAAVSSRISESSNRRKLVIFTWNGSNSGKFAALDPSATTDDTYAANGTKFDSDGTTSLVTIPPGNHVNRLRVPYLNPVLHSIFIERTLYEGDTDPEVYFYKDDLYNKPMPTRPEAPSRRNASIGYKTTEHHANEGLHRTALNITKYNSADAFEIQNIIFVFAPDGGA